MKTVLYRTTAKCATQCTAKIFFARIANQQPHLPCSQPDQSAPTPTTNVGAKHFSPESQPATPHTLFTTRPVSPNTTNQRRGEIFFARNATSNTACPICNPTVIPNTTIQCRGEIFFARIATHKHLAPCIQPNQSAPTPRINVGAKYFSPESQTSNHTYPVRNPTRLPQHHQPTCGRKIFRPYRKPSPPHTLYATRPVIPNIICQRAGENYFAPTTFYRYAFPQ